MKKRSISVIIPTLNRNKHLQKCLNSLINQTIKPDEIIIIDNSINKTAEDSILKYNKKNKKITIRYFFEKRKGTTYARNLGILNAKGEYLLFIDDDCVAEKSLIEIYLKAFKKNKIILGNVKDASNNIYSHLENLDTKYFFRKGLKKQKDKYYSFFLDSKNFAIKRSLVVKNNLYFNNNYAQYSIFEDIELGLRINFFHKKKILFEKNAVVYHSGRDNLYDHLKREWRKGRGNLYFLNDFISRYQNQIINKGEIKFLINFYRESSFYNYVAFIKKNIKKYSFCKKLFLLFLVIILNRVIFFLGFTYEVFKLKISK